MKLIFFDDLVFVLKAFKLAVIYRIKPLMHHTAFTLSFLQCLISTLSTSCVLNLPSKVSIGGRLLLGTFNPAHVLNFIRTLLKRHGVALLCEIFLF